MPVMSVKSRIKGATGRVQRECPLCGCTELDYEFIVENCPLCCCRECSLSFLNPQPGGDEPSGADLLEAGAGIYEKNLSSRNFSPLLGINATT